MCNTFHPLLYNNTGCIYCTSHVILLPFNIYLCTSCTLLCLLFTTPVYSNSSLYIFLRPCCCVVLCHAVYFVKVHREPLNPESNSLFVQIYLANKRDSEITLLPKAERTVIWGGRLWHPLVVIGYTYSFLWVLTNRPSVEVGGVTEMKVLSTLKPFSRR